MSSISNKEEIAKYYQDKSLAEGYTHARFFTPLGKYLHLIQIRNINEVIKKFQCNKILDLACGPARLDKDISGFEKAIGLDSSPAMLKLAKKYAPMWKYIQGDAFNTKFKNCSFDLVFTFRFIRHFKIKERKKMYAEIRRILKKEGICIFDAVNYEKDFRVRKRVGLGKYKVYDKLFKKDELLKELDKNRLEITRLIPCINHLYTITLISKITSKLKLDKLGLRLIRAIEKIESKNPLEWIVICKKK